MIIEAILQLDKGLNAANVNKVFNLTLKSFLDRDHSNALYYMGNSRSGNSVIWIPENAMRDFQNIFYNPPLHLKALEKHSHCLHNELEGTSPQGVVRLGRNV